MLSQPPMSGSAPVSAPVQASPAPPSAPPPALSQPPQSASPGMVIIMVTSHRMFTLTSCSSSSHQWSREGQAGKGQTEATGTGAEKERSTGMTLNVLTMNKYWWFVCFSAKSNRYEQTIWHDGSLWRKHNIELGLQLKALLLTPSVLRIWDENEAFTQLHDWWGLAVLSLTQICIC